MSEPDGGCLHLLYPAGMGARITSSLVILTALLFARPGVLPGQSLSDSKPARPERQQRESTIPNEAAPTTPTTPPNQDFLTQWFEGDALLGNWGGERDELIKEGVTFFGSYEADMADNVQGGRSSGQAYADNINFGLRFDMQKLAGWDGAKIVVNGLDRNGQNLSANHIGNFFPVQQVYGGQTLFLYGLFLDQSFLDDQLSWKAGRFAMTDDFATSPIYGLYMNNGIDGNPKSLLVTDAFSAYPGSSWATRLRYDPSRELTLKVGASQADNRIYEPNKHGVDFGIRGYDGVTFLGEVDWSPVFFEDRSAAETTAAAPVHRDEEPPVNGLAGHYWFGGYYSTLALPEFTNSTTGSGPTIVHTDANESYGFYWHADQMVYQARPNTKEGLTLWIDFMLEPNQSTQLLPYEINGGATYRGLIPARPDDVFIFGAMDGIFNRNHALTAETLGVVDAGSEQVYEFAYQVQMTKFFYVQPDVQWVVHPSGTDAIEDAVVLGLRLGITF